MKAGDIVDYYDRLLGDKTMKNPPVHFRELCTVIRGRLSKLMNLQAIDVLYREHPLERPLSPQNIDALVQEVRTIYAELNLPLSPGSESAQGTYQYPLIRHGQEIIAFLRGSNPSTEEEHPDVLPFSVA